MSLWKTYGINVMKIQKGRRKERGGGTVTWALIKTRGTIAVRLPNHTPDPMLRSLCFLANLHDNPER